MDAQREIQTSSPISINGSLGLDWAPLDDPLFWSALDGLDTGGGGTVTGAVDGGAVASTRSYTRGQGDVSEISEKDVLLGRGKGCYDHPGNKSFRDLVCERYRHALIDRDDVHARSKLAKEIVEEVLQEGGIFKKRNPQNNGWMEASHDDAIKKAVQRLFSEHRRCNTPRRALSLDQVKNTASIVVGPLQDDAISALTQESFTSQPLPAQAYQHVTLQENDHQPHATVGGEKTFGETIVDKDDEQSIQSDTWTSVSDLDATDLEYGFSLFE